MWRGRRSPRSVTNLSPSSHLSLQQHDPLRCLYSVAHPKRNRWFAPMKKALFRIAFAGIILAELVLYGLLIAALSSLFPQSNSLSLHIIFGLSFVGLLLIGAGSHLLFQRLTRVEYILAESERWLAEQQKKNSHWIKRRKLLKRCAIWIPIVTVVLACMFLDATFALTSHLLHPRPVKIIGYRVSIPLNWTIGFSAPYENESDTWSFVTANRTNGMLRAGLDFYSGRQSHLTIAEIAF